MRKTPYTEDEIIKQPCYRCGQPATQQWQICADNNVFRPICVECDIELNELVLDFVKDKDAAKKIKKYARRMRSIK